MNSRPIRRFALSLGAAALLMALFAPSAFSKLTVSTSSASSVGQTSAVLKGKIEIGWEERETPITYAFEYGPTTAYGSETEPKVVSSSSWLPPNVYATATGLKPGTTYHYRIGAYAEGGELLYGEDRTFTTVPPAKFRADQYPATLSGTQDAADNLVIGLEKGLDFSCEEVSFGGSLTEAAMSLSLSPLFADCRALGLTAAVKTNGCTFAFHTEEVVGDPSTMDIVCPVGKSIQVTAGTCEMTIPAQSGLASSTATNDTSVSPQRVRLALNVSGLTYVKVKDGFICPFSGTGTLSDGTVTGSASVGGTNGSGAAIGVRVAGN